MRKPQKAQKAQSLKLKPAILDLEKRLVEAGGLLVEGAWSSVT